MRLTKRIKQRRGQGLTEYVIIVGLIAIACVAAVQTFGTTLEVAIVGSHDQFESSAGNQIQQQADTAGQGADPNDPNALTDTGAKTLNGNKPIKVDNNGQYHVGGQSFPSLDAAINSD